MPFTTVPFKPLHEKRSKRYRLSENVMSSANFLHCFCSINSQVTIIRKLQLNIISPSYVYSSCKAYNSCYVYSSFKVYNSSYFYSSFKIYNSSYVYSSFKIYNSTYVYSSFKVYNSSYVYSSFKIYNSSYV